MVRHYKRKVGTRPYRNYGDDKLHEALQAITTGKMSLRKAHKAFSIPLGTLCNKLRNKHESTPGHPISLSREEELSLVEHVQVVAKWGFPFDLTDLRILVNTYLTQAGRTVVQFKGNFPSREWAFNFLRRHKDALTRRQCQNIKVARASVSKTLIVNFFNNLQVTMKNDDGSEIPAANIFNYDETNLSDDPGTRRCIFKRGTKYPERIRDSTKSSTSIMFCGSAIGVMLPAYVVYKAEHMWSTWTEGGPKHTRYNRSKSGWFDMNCFSDWFETLFVPHVKQLPGRTVIIGDNLSSHFSDSVLRLAKEHDIVFTCLPANSTHLLQPLDVAFYGPLKKCWRVVLDEWKASSKKTSQTVGKESFPRLLEKLYQNLYQPEGQTTNHTSQNLVSGFRKCGIYPLERNEVLERLPDGQTDVDLNVSGAVMEMLQNMRGVDEEPVKKRKKKVTVAPGKSISFEDIQVNSTMRTASTSTPYGINRVLPGVANEVGATDRTGEAGLSSSSAGEEDGNDSEEEGASNTGVAGTDINNVYPTGPMNAKWDNSELLDKKEITVGQYVVVTYEGSTFPGKIISVEEVGAIVSVLTKCKGQGWRWPDPKDEILYFWGNIVKTIPGGNIMPINTRGGYRVVDMEKSWGK